MDKLPFELLRQTLQQCLYVSRHQKNSITILRTVCKKWDVVLKEYTCRTVQVEFSRFILGDLVPDLSVLSNFSGFTRAVFLDMSIIRDQEETDKFKHLLGTIPGKFEQMEDVAKRMAALCLSNERWNEKIISLLVTDVFKRLPGMQNLKINLPSQISGKSTRTALLLLANIFKCLRYRQHSPEVKPLETLAIGNLSDQSLRAICRNPIDLQNAMFTMRFLKNLVLTINISMTSRQQSLPGRVWLLITSAHQLQSLSIVDWCFRNSGGSAESRTSRRRGFSRPRGYCETLLYAAPKGRKMPNLTSLELKFLIIYPRSMLDLISDVAGSLRELFLTQVYLKIEIGDPSTENSRWICRKGSDETATPAEGEIRLAPELRNIETLSLAVLRVSGLGYIPSPVAGSRLRAELFDIEDPLGLDRNLDERFVAAVLGTDDSNSIKTTAVEHHEDDSSLLPDDHQISRLGDETMRQNGVKSDTREAWDMTSYQVNHDTPLRWDSCIDGIFYNDNEKARAELIKIKDAVNDGVQTISFERDDIINIELSELLEPEDQSMSN